MELVISIALGLWIFIGGWISYKTLKKEYNPKMVLIGVGSQQIELDYHIEVECKNEIHQLFANVIILQQLALEIALKLGCNVDNPKGLQKVVFEENVRV